MEPVPTDFWGIVVPAWLGAIGSIAASTVAVYAYINGRAAKGAIEELRDPVNRSMATIVRDGVLSATISGSATATVVDPWDFDGSGKVGTFRNTSGETLTVSGISAVGGIDLTLRDQFPLTVPPTASFQVRIHRILGGPAVTGVTLDWTRENGMQLTRTFYL